METVQQIMDMRKLVPSLPAHIEAMKKIEPLLNVKEMGVWRTAGGPSSYTSGSQWKTRSSARPPMRENSPRPQQQPPVKYESKFHSTADVPVETTILNSILLNKLNKFSPSTYTEVRDFIYQIIDKGEADFIKNFMRLVFKKAVAEEIYCPLYAKLLSELRSTYPVIQTEMMELFNSYMMIFDSLSPTMSANTVDYQTFVNNSVEKKYRLGYSQFLSELVLLDAVDIDILKKTFEILIQNIYIQGRQIGLANEVQEYTDCLLRMTRPFLKRKTNLRNILYDIIKQKLCQMLSEPRDYYPGLLPKSRFAMMDIQENLCIG